MSAARPDDARLDSWKAIAVYLRRDVRTVQRWEEKEGLPVHRLQHDRLASVYGFTHEIDEWVARRSVGPRALAEIAAAEPTSGERPAPPAPARLERRDIAVLVMRIAQVGYLADERSPEALRHDLQTLNRAVDGCRDRFGAHVLGTFGDHAVLAFGLFRAEEDDAVRAARAARSVQEAAVSVGIAVTGGLAFGPILASGMSPGTSAPSGAAMDEARLLAAHAQDDDILIGPSVARLVDPFFTTVSRTPVLTLGQLLAVRALSHEAAVHSRFDAAMRRGLSAYVGRAAEVHRLLEAWQATSARGGRVLHVLGEAGMGKSRLLLEFRRALGGGTGPFAHGRCAPQGRTSSYLPFVEAISEILSLPPAATDEGVVVACVRRLDQTLEPFIPHYLHLLGVSSATHPLPSYLQGFELKVALREALAAVFLTTAARSPLILLLEDWHWADEGSTDVLQHLAHAVSSVPLLVIVTSRSEGLSAGAVPPGLDTMTLDPLSADDTGALVRSLVSAGPVSTGFMQQVYSRTGGNPFFVEELCDSIQEQGRDGSASEPLQIPSTVQAVIRARIDRLGAEDREVLRTAAVVGRECTRDVLAELMPDPVQLDDSLRRLTSARILQALRLGRDSTFRFKHTLTQEVAYLSVPAFERKTLHLRLAALLAVTHAAQPDQHADLLAFHFGRAEAWGQAARFGLRAARRAYSLSQFARAVELLEQAQRAFARMPSDDREPRLLGEILLLEERACEMLGDRSEQETLFARALQTLEGASDSDLLAEALARLGDLRTIQAQFAEARERIERALSLCQANGNRAAERSAWRSMAFSAWRQGREEDAVRCNEQALEIAKALGDRDGIAMDLASIAAILRGQQRYPEALDRLAAAERVQGLSPVAASYVYQVSSSVLTSMGDREGAADVLEYVVTQVQIPGGVPIHRVFSILSLARLHLDAGQGDTAEQLFGECVARCRELSYLHGLSMALPGLADVYLQSRRWPEAAACLEETLAILDRLHETEGVVDHRERLAWVQVELGDWTQARKAGERSAEAAVRLGDTARGIATMERIARGLLDRRAPHDEVRATFDRALQLAESVGDDEARGRILNALGIAEFAARQYTRARQHFDHAREIFERRGPAAAVALMLNSVGATLRALGRRQEAIRQLESSLEVLGDADEPRLRGHAMALLGDVYRELNDQDSARAWYERTIALREQVNDCVGQAWMHQRLALLHCDAGLADLAREQLGRARELMTGDAPDRLREAVTELISRLSLA